MPLNTKTITFGGLAVASTTAVATSQSGSSITINGGDATAGVATLDQARRVIVTSGGNDTGVTFLITGTDRYSRLQTEILTGASGAAAQTVHDFLTVSAVKPSGAVASYVTVGTNGVGSSDAYITDWVPNGNLMGCQCTIAGTVNYTIQECMDDYAPTWDQTVNTFNWFNDANIASLSAAKNGTLAGPFTALRVLINSGTGTVTAKFITPFIGGAI